MSTECFIKCPLFLYHRFIWLGVDYKGQTLTRRKPDPSASVADGRAAPIAGPGATASQEHPYLLLSSSELLLASRE